MNFLHSPLKILCPVQIVGQRSAFFTSQGQGSEVINIMVYLSSKMFGLKWEYEARHQADSNSSDPVSSSLRNDTNQGLKTWSPNPYCSIHPHLLFQILL